MPELIALRLLHMTAALGVFGLLVFAVCVPHLDTKANDSASWQHWLVARLLKWCRTCAVIALATWLLWLPAQATAMSGLPRSEAWTASVIGTVLGQTEFGSTWILRCGLLVALVLLLLSPAGVRMRGLAYDLDLALAAAAVGLIASLGHANRGGGVSGLIHWTSDALHLLGAAAWLGGLPPLLVLIFAGHPHGRRGISPRDMATVLNRFSDLASVSVGALVAGAAVNTWFVLRASSDLWSTTYGLMISAKIGLLSVMLMLAAHNRLILVPRLLQSPRGTYTGPPSLSVAELKRNIALELGAGAVLLVIVSVLGLISP